MIVAALLIAAVVMTMKIATMFGEKLAEIGVDADSSELRFRLFGRTLERLGVIAPLDLLDFLLRLPEEQARADRRA